MLAYMNYGITHLALVPVRLTPSDKAEILTFLLFGECFQVLECSDKWTFVKAVYDGYEGWIDNKQYVNLDEHLCERMSTSYYISHDLLNRVINETTGESFLIPMGSCLPFWNGSSCSINMNSYRVEGNVGLFTPIHSPTQIIAVAKLFLHTPYLWGGKACLGIDCSGFVQIVYKRFGIKLLRDANEQVQQGITVVSLSEAQTGDLAFFENQEKKITHVGILLNRQQIIHASGCVRIDAIDEQGIYKIESDAYSHSLSVIKRVV